MLSYHYCFRLSDNALLLDPKDNKKQVAAVFNEITGIAPVRIAIDMTHKTQRVSVLTHVLATEELRKKLSQALKEHILSDGAAIDVERLDNDPHQEVSGCCHHHEQEHSHCEHAHDHSSEKPHQHTHDNHWLKAGIGLLWGLGLLILSLTGITLPLIAYYLITAVTTAISLYVGSTVFQSAWNALRHKKWDTSVLYAISTLTIVLVSVAAPFVPGLSMMFEAAPLVLGFWHLGEGIEHTLISKINKKLDVRDCLPSVVRLHGDEDQDIEIQQLIPNDCITVNPGSVIPVNGQLITSAVLYTTRINGSPELHSFKSADLVKAGMTVAAHAAPVTLRVTHSYQNSYLSLIAKNIEQANKEKAPVEVFANKILKYFIPGLLAIALISGVVIGLLFTPALAIQCMIAVLVSACPCALSLITPSAVKIAMSKASKYGIHFNNGKSLQAAADIDTLVFDLNGTLTKGEIEVSECIISEPDTISYFALLEEQSSHPIAKIIHAHLIKKAGLISKSLAITAIDKSHHSGIKAMIDGSMFMIGNKDFLTANKIATTELPSQKGLVYLVRDAHIVGHMVLKDSLRDDAIATVAALKRMGKTVHICTGADEVTAAQFAEELGISKEHLCANAQAVSCQPGDVSKALYIQQLQCKGHKVSMVGDAVNDLTAIAYANVGIAVKSAIGDEITQQQAGIVVQKGLLFPIASAFDVATKTKNNIIQNLSISLAYNSAITLVASGLFVALGFALNPVVGVVLMVIESSIVLANLYRFKQQTVLVKPEKNQSTTATLLCALGRRPFNEDSANLDQKPNPRAQEIFKLTKSIQHRSESDVIAQDLIPHFNCSP